MSLMQEFTKTDQERFTLFFSETFPDLNASLRTLVRIGDVADEILQNVALILWEKYRLATQKEDFRKLAFTVMRYEVLSYRRDRMRNRLYFDDGIVSLLVDQSSEMKTVFTRNQELLNKNIAKLSEEDRELIFAVYQSDMTIPELARQREKTPASLYKRVQKIRNSLFEKIQAEINAKNNQID